MVALVRKIQRSKWTKNLDKYNETGEVTPYPVTNDMKTCANNTLSVWEINDDDDDELENIVLTIASMRDSLQALDIVIFSKDKISKSGISIVESEGKTPLEDFNSYHRDLNNLSLADIEYISNEIIKYVILSNDEPDEVTMRFTRSTLRKMYIKKIKAGVIDIDDLNESFQNYIRKKL